MVSKITFFLKTHMEDEKDERRKEERRRRMSRTCAIEKKQWRGPSSSLTLLGLQLVLQLVLELEREK